MGGWSDHLIAAPILIPLVAAGLTLGLRERRQTPRRGISLAATFLLILVSFVVRRPPAAI